MDDWLVFADETADSLTEARAGAWKVLIVDDDQEIHLMTKLVLKDVEFEQRRLELIDAYSGEEACQILDAHKDIAVVLLDVVMETEDAGLRVVKYVRETLGNSFIRIILRTGQAGQAPEKTVISSYDINDYKEKTELTATKIFTVIVSSLRSYSLLTMVDRNRKGLELILDSVRDLGRVKAFGEFSQGILTQIISLLKMDGSGLYLRISGFAADFSRGKVTVLAGIGEFETEDYKTGARPLPGPVRSLLERALAEKRSFFQDGVFVGYMAAEEMAEVRLLYLNGCDWLDSSDRHLLRTFVENMSFSFDSLYRDKMLWDGTQGLSSIVEYLLNLVTASNPSPGAGLRKFSQICALLAQKAGADPRETERIRMASVLADMPSPDEALDCVSPEKPRINPLVCTALDILRCQKIPWSDRQKTGEELPFAARVAAVARVAAESLASGTNLNEALAQVSGSQCDPRICDLAREAEPELATLV